MDERLVKFKEYIEKNHPMDRFWFENGELWAKKEEDEIMMLSMKSKLEYCMIQIYWKGFLANEDVGLNCVVNVKKKNFSTSDIDLAFQKYEQFLEMAEKEREKIVGESI